MSPAAACSLELSSLKGRNQIRWPLSVPGHVFNWLSHPSDSIGWGGRLTVVLPNLCPAKSQTQDASFRKRPCGDLSRLISTDTKRKVEEEQSALVCADPRAHPWVLLIWELRVCPSVQRGLAPVQCLPWTQAQLWPYVCFPGGVAPELFLSGLLLKQWVGKLN